MLWVMNIYIVILDQIFSIFKVFELILPPIPVISTGAQHIWSAIYDHPVTQPIWKFARRLAKSKIQYSIMEFDGATSNDRLYSELQNQSEWGDVLNFGMVCRNHATNLTIICISGVLGLGITNSLYCLSAVLNLGGHFLRLVAKVTSYVACIQI